MAMHLKRLKELRKQYNLTQEQVAEFIDMSRSAYTMYEIGEREMDYELLIKLADHYNVSTDYLLGRTDNPIHMESYTYDEIEFINRTIEIYKSLKTKYM